MSSKRKYMNLSLNKTASNMYEFNKAIVTMFAGENTKQPIGDSP